MTEAPEQIHIHGYGDYILATPAALSDHPTVKALVEAEFAALRDPLVVHLNMVAGKIAKPLPSQLVHIYGEEVIRAAFASLVAEAEARGMERAANLIDKRADDYHAEHGIYDYSTDVTEYPGTGSESMEEWEDLSDLIRAEAAAIKGETT